MIQFPCTCGRMLQGRDEDAGKRTKCPACGEESVIPSSHAVTTEEGSPAPRPRSDAVRQGRRRDEDADEDEDRPRRKPRRDVVAEGTSGKATASMILGLMAFPCIFSILTGIPAIILGALALKDINNSEDRLGGKVMAIIGLITGILSLLIVVPLGLLIPAVFKVRDAAARMTEQNNLKQVGLAMHNFASTNGGNQLPQAAAFRSKDGKPLLSWRVALLPYIEQDMLYRQFKLDEPWDSPTNIKLLPMIPRTYLQPDQQLDGRGLTHYQVFVGPNTVFPDMPGKPGEGPAMKGPPPFPGQPWLGTNIGGIPDGTSNTIMVAVAENGVPWTKPEDLVYDPKGPLPALSKRFSSGYNIGLADGSVRFVHRNVSEQTLRNAITVNDGQVLGPDW
jgi:hypothetical protein